MCLYRQGTAPIEAQGKEAHDILNVNEALKHTPARMGAMCHLKQLLCDATSSYSNGLRKLVEVARANKQFTQHQLSIKKIVTECRSSLPNRTMKTLKHLDICELKLCNCAIPFSPVVLCVLCDRLWKAKWILTSATIGMEQRKRERQGYHNLVES